MTEIEIIPTRLGVPGELGLMGIYNYNQNKIYYHFVLENHPELKKRVIAHELEHAKHRKNMLFHLYLDIMETFRLNYSSLFLQYLAANKEEQGPGYKKETIFELGAYILYTLTHSVIISIITILSIPWRIYYTRKFNQNEKSKK